MCGIGDLGYNRQTGSKVRLVQQLEAFGLETLEGVRRRAGLPCAAAQHGCAVGLHMLGHVNDLLLTLDRARACHDDQLFAAHHNARCNLNLGIVRMELAVCQLERLLYLDDILHLRVAQQRVLIHSARVADQADDDRAFAVNRVCLDIPALNVLGQFLNVLAGRALLHDDNHSCFSPFG